MRILNFSKTAWIAAALASTLPASTAALAEEANPFSQLAGKWHGSGQVRLSDGHAERLSCQGNYSQKSGGNELLLAIRCQS